jgi:hypothetical protein
MRNLVLRMFGQQAGFTGGGLRRDGGCGMRERPDVVQRGVAVLGGVAQRGDHFTFLHLILSLYGHETRLIRVVRAAVAHQLSILLIWSLLPLSLSRIDPFLVAGVHNKVIGEHCRKPRWVFLSHYFSSNVSNTPRHPGAVVLGSQEDPEKQAN